MSIIDSSFLPASHVLPAAIEYHARGRLHEARALYREVLHIDPGNACALELLALLAETDEF